MAPQGSGLIINVTFQSSGSPPPYLGCLMYDLAKASLNRWALAGVQARTWQKA